jgi:hypothetical protein
MAKAKKMEEKQRKNLDFTSETIKVLSIEAIEKGFGNFKNYVEHLIEEHAKKRINKKK